jgi:invasion protein IalB
MKLTEFLKASFVVCLLASLNPVASVADQPQPKPQSSLTEIRDWIVGCDNRQSCHVTNLPLTPTLEGTQSYGDRSSLGRVQISVKRDAAAQAAAILTISLTSLFPDERPIRPITALQVDDELLGISFEFEGTNLVLPPCGDKALLDRLLNGTTLSFLDQNGVAMAGVSLKGLKEAMDYMAERQAASNVKPPEPEVAYSMPRATRASARLKKSALARLRPNDLCGIARQNRRMPTESFHRLDDGRTLALIPPVCSFETSNIRYRVAVLDNAGQLTPLEFDTKLDGLGPDMLSNASWNTQTLRLEARTYARVLGDCGVAHSYAWDGRRFRLVEIREMSVCRGSRDLITTWRENNEVRRVRP